MHKIFITFFVFALETAFVWSDCDISWEKADECGMKSGFFGNREAEVPTNDAELDTFCANLNTNMKCIEDFNEKCLTGKVQFAIRMGINSGKKFSDKRCNNGKERQDFLTHIKCLHPKEKMEPFHLCSEKHLVMLTKLGEIAKPDRVPALCCITHLSQECMRNEFKKNCGEETKNYWDDAWDEITSDNMEFACSEFADIDKCHSHLDAGAWTVLKEAANSDSETILAARHKFKSELRTAIDIMKIFE